MTRKALGKGLEALIPRRQPEPAVHPPAHPHPQAGLLQLELDRIVPNPHQPRKEFSEERLAELAQSIAAKGVIQPVIVRPLGDGSFELIAGERRWRAARQAGITKVPAVVRAAETNESMELALIENIQRQDLNPIETAVAYSQLVETYGLSHEEVAARVNKDRSSVTNHLRLLNLPQEIQSDVSAGTLSMGHARALLGIGERQGQLAAWRIVIRKGLSVRETEALVKRLAEMPGKKRPPVGKKDLYIKEIEDSIRRSLGTKVSVRHQGNAGVIELHYFSTEELDRLVNHLRGKEFA